MSKFGRVIGTTEEALARAESSLGRKFPTSFRAWLAKHNGIGLEDIVVFPVLDDGDRRKTWDSIVRQFELWQSYCSDVFGSRTSFSGLLPFASFGTGDYYCFDFERAGSAGEPQVVHWSHETGATLFRAQSFEEFVRRVEAGELEND